MDSKNKPEIVIEGIAASPGIAHGRAFVIVQTQLELPVYRIDPSQRSGEVARLEQALLATRQQIMKVQQEIARNLGEDEARIFDAHLMVLEDQALISETLRELDKSQRNIEACFRDVAQRYVDAFGQIDDEYLRERASDIRDVVQRVLHNLTGRAIANLSKMAEDHVLVAHDITPSESAAFDSSRVLGIVTDAGSKTSHAVIMARSMKISAVVGARDATKRVAHEDWVIVDGYDGVLVVNPSEQTLFRYGKLQLQRKSFEKRMLAGVRQPAQTLDRRKVPLLANIDSADDLGRARDGGAEGVGLFRTEYLFLQAEVMPTEEMQYQAYRRVAEFFGQEPVVIRTMDLGGDKPVRWASFGDVPESNPFLGFRAIRFCLENINLFKDQLRAILRSSVHGNVRLMFPMISGAEELERALEVLEQARQELRQRGQPFDPKMQVGSMIEIPSAAIAADILAQKCDFFSVGTNDLIQYLLAVDRVNTRTAHLYEPTHPAVLRTLKTIFDAAHDAGIKAAVCGEMAGDPVMVPLLLGLGADELSVAPSNLPAVKYLVQNMKIADAVRLARDGLRNRDPKATAAHALEFYKQRVGEFS
jgi:phosphoenolpyruvate-protein phosphotransferase (PTS system enzyme I)